jgi:hypothetical protein
METFKLRQLRDGGIKKMSLYLDSCNTESPLQYPEDILSDPVYADTVSDVEIERRTFSNKLEISGYLHGLFVKAGMTDVAANKGLWCWLSLLFFEQLCPRGRGGRFKPGARPRWIPSGDWKTYYRHLLAGPYRVYYFHRDDPQRTMALMCGSINQQGEVFEQIASRLELVTNKSLIEATTRLYFDKDEGKNKRGAGGKGAGSPRRLAEVIDQFNLTWDLYSMEAPEIIELLPAEFDRFVERGAV